MRIAIACHEIVLTGGLLRFERFGRVARSRGHELAFLCFSPMPPAVRSTAFPVLSFQEAERLQWDVTMVPGAGFPAETIASFSDLQQPQFGLRMQHVLNDRTRMEAFLGVNASFLPHKIIFNNRDWTHEVFSSFAADELQILEGAVDTGLFAPTRYKRLSGPDDPFIIGGQATKNPMPLIEALRQLDDAVTLRLFGPPGDLPETATDLVQAGRLSFTGPLDDAGMSTFYSDLDCVVHTETFAGWANMGAEALASGVPLICTKPGTLAFAKHEETALVLPNPTSECIVAEVSRLRSSSDLVRSLSARGRARIVEYSWESYTTSLLKLVAASSGKSDYKANLQINS